MRPMPDGAQALEAVVAYRDACPWLKAAGPNDAFFMGARGGALDPAIVQKRVRDIDSSRDRAVIKVAESRTAPVALSSC